MTVIDFPTQQRLTALERANEARVFKKDRKTALKHMDDPFGCVTGMIRTPEGHEGSFGVDELLRSLPGVRQTRARTLLKQAQVSGERKLRDLTPGQRARLAVAVELMRSKREVRKQKAA